MIRPVAALLLLAGCKLVLGDPDRIIALDLVGSAEYTLAAGDTLHLKARAVAANGDTVPDAMIEWAVLDTGTVGIVLTPESGTVEAKLVGTWHVQAAVEDIRSDSIRITVTPGAADSLAITGIGPAATAGTAADLNLSAYDLFGNVATGYTGTVHFTSSDAGATLPADYPFTASDAGVHTFVAAVTLQTAGTQTISATDVTNAMLTASTSVVVEAPSLARPHPRLFRNVP